VLTGGHGRDVERSGTAKQPAITVPGWVERGKLGSGLT
jgi:hypothetical protein